MFVLVIFGTAPSSSGLGLWLLKSATRVRIPSGLHLPNYQALAPKPPSKS